ncbi:MAG: hypothetical protein NZ958_01195 [Bacteroidia bacterium]|nr:hypothetical protein [Bacteroidia bacterium]MDW8089279.1 hypothetical protein [Bacteroidia bacterium]
MSGIGLGLLLLWGAFIGLWLIRLPIERLYAPQPWVVFWLGFRALLRLGVGLFGLLWWESVRLPASSPFYVVVLDARCPQAWNKAEDLFKRLYYKGLRAGLLVATAEEAFWAIPPTTDPEVFRLLFEVMEASRPFLLTYEIPLTPAKSLAKLRPWAEEVWRAIFVGNFTKEPLSIGANPPVWVPLCARLSEPKDEPELDAPLVSEETFALGFFLCGLALLVGEGGLYILRQGLPLRSAA